MRSSLAMLLLLAACAQAAPPTTPEETCARHVDDDPIVHETLQKATEPDWLWQNAGKVEIVKRQAIARCLRARGGFVPGGVERLR